MSKPAKAPINLTKTPSKKELDVASSEEASDNITTVVKPIAKKDAKTPEIVAAKPPAKKEVKAAKAPPAEAKDGKAVKDAKTTKDIKTAKDGKVVKEVKATKDGKKVVPRTKKSAGYSTEEDIAAEVEKRCIDPDVRKKEKKHDIDPLKRFDKILGVTYRICSDAFMKEIINRGVFNIGYGTYRTIKTHCAGKVPKYNTSKNKHFSLDLKTMTYELYNRKKTRNVSIISDENVKDAVSDEETEEDIKAREEKEKFDKALKAAAVAEGKKNPLAREKRITIRHTFKFNRRSQLLFRFILCRAVYEFMNVRAKMSDEEKRNISIETFKENIVKHIGEIEHQSLLLWILNAHKPDIKSLATLTGILDEKFSKSIEPGIPTPITEAISSFIYQIMSSMAIEMWYTNSQCINSKNIIAEIYRIYANSIDVTSSAHSDVTIMETILKVESFFDEIDTRVADHKKKMQDLKNGAKAAATENGEEQPAEGQASDPELDDGPTGEPDEVTQEDDVIDDDAAELDDMDNMQSPIPGKKSKTDPISDDENAFAEES